MHPDDRLTGPVRISYYRAPAGQSQVSPMRIAEGIEYVELITGGGVYFTLETGETQYCTEGTLFWHLPGEYTIHQYKPEKPYECFVAVFPIEAPHRRVAPHVTVMRHPESALRLAADFLHVFHDEAADLNILAASLYSRLLWEAYSSELTVPAPGTPPVLQQAMHLIELDFATGLTVPLLAEQLGVSVPKLYVLFRKHLGKSPHAWIRERRLNAAKDRLAVTADPLKTIAADCGFPRVEHFCRLFREQFSLTPTEYRKKYGIPR